MIKDDDAESSVNKMDCFKKKYHSSSYIMP